MAADLFAQQFGNQSPQNAYFKKLLDQGLDTTPIQSPWQGASRMAMALLAGLDLRDQDQQEKASQALRMNLPGLGPQPAQPAAQSGLADALAKPAADTSVPRGIRNNNPLNIEAGDFTKGQPGFTGSDGRFAQFGSMDQGTAAANKLLDTYQNKYGLNTVGGIINRWAPPGENDSRGYAASVAGRMGVGADQPLTPEQRPALIAAMGQFENGRPIPQQTAQTDPGALPPNSAPAQGQIPAVPPQRPAGPSGTAPYQRAPFQIEPGMAQQLQKMIGSKDPAIQQQGMQIYNDERKKYLEQKRPLTDPAERTRQGFQPTDTNPYQIDAHGTVTPVNPQPFAVNVNQQGESKFAQAYGEGKAADALSLERSADKTMQERQQLQVFKSLVQDFKTGKLAPAQSTIGAWADAIGLDPKTMEKLGVPPNAGVNGQLIDSLSNQMTLGMIGTKGGEGGAMPANNFSDADRKFLKDTVPGLGRMQGGNLVLAEIKQRGLDRQLEKISMWDDYRSQGKSYEKFERDWRDKVRNGPDILADLPDMVRGLTNQPNAAGWSPPNAQPATQAAPASNGGIRKFDRATGKIE